MHPLHLSGWGVRMRVQNLQSRSELEIIDGREDGKIGAVMRFRPRRFPYSSIIIDGHSGYVSLQAFHWLSKHKIPIFVMDYDGTVISSILPPMPVKADLRGAQFQAASDPKKKFTIARELVQAKILRSLQVLDWLGERYDISREIRATKTESLKLRRATTVSDLRVVEGRVARRYWKGFGKVLPEHLDFQGRMTTTHQNNASDPFNAALNYGYGFLEAECRMAINAVGLEPAVGFLHEFSNYQTKQSLVYDLEEPFRWLIDVSVVEAFESGALDLCGFYFTGNDYRYRFRADAKQRFIEALREQLNAGASYKDRVLKWDTIIEQKAIELGRYLCNRSTQLDFFGPAPILKSCDDLNIKQAILNLTDARARKLGVGKTTLHYLRKRAERGRPVKAYSKTVHKLKTEAIAR